MSSDVVPRVYEIRVGGCADLNEALELQEPIARLLCPEPEHPGPCEVPWGFGVDEDGALVLGVVASAERAAEVATRVRGSVGAGCDVTLSEGDPERFAELVEQYRIENAGR